MDVSFKRRRARVRNKSYTGNSFRCGQFGPLDGEKTFGQTEKQ